MKTIKMKSLREINKIYRAKCLTYRKLIKKWTINNATVCDRTATIQQHLRMVCQENKALLKKLAEYNAAAHHTQLYYKGKRETKLYPNYCKERTTRKRKQKS